MNLPSNLRSLFALGFFCALGGAWLTFVTEARLRSRGETTREPAISSASAHPPAFDPASGSPSAAESPQATHAGSTPVRGSAVVERNIAARSRIAPTDAERVAAARRQLDFLELQKPENFLVIFDMMKGEGHADPKQLDAARAESHRYIIARTKVLERMLRRFIDDPGADQGLEKDALAHLDDTFRAKFASFARDIPQVANVQEMLTTTTLKAPAFAESPAPSDEPDNGVVD